MKKMLLLSVMFAIPVLTNAFPSAGEQGGSNVDGNSTLSTTTVVTGTSVTTDDNAEANVQIGNTDVEGMNVGGDLESTSTTVSENTTVSATDDSKANVKVGGTGK